MLRPGRAAVAVLVCGALGACGGMGGTAPSDDAGPADRLDSLARQDQRVAAIAFRLSTANADLCPDRGPGAGWTLHSATQYSAEMRPFAEARFGLDRALPGVLAVAPGSPAAEAGLRTGDLLLAVDGRALEPGDGLTQSFAGLAANLSALDEAMADGPVALDYRRDGQVATARLTPVAACTYPFQIDPSDDRRARADGRRVFVTTAMLAFVPRDQDLAFVLAHELAHNVLRHSASTQGADGRSGPEVLPWRLVEDEREADRVGLYLMARAGYPVDGVDDFLLWTAEADWRFRYPQWGHDSAATRARAASATASEIAGKQARGLPLDP